MGRNLFRSVGVNNWGFNQYSKHVMIRSRFAF